MKKRHPTAGFVLAAAMLAAGCDEKLSDIAGPTPDLQPTFSTIQAQIFEATDSAGRLACIQCHTDSGRTPSGGLNLRHDVAYANLVGVASTGKPGAVRVIPGDSVSSYIIHKLEGAPDIAGVRMPRGNGPFLTEGQMLILKRWIALGAPRD